MSEEKKGPRPILLIEDDDDEIAACVQKFERGGVLNPVIALESAGEAFEFLFRLPGGGLVEGTAEVVRQTNPLREGVDGIGTRFTGFRNDCQDRLAAHIERQIQLGNAR